jgi:heme/copper-type cytochrome/quinol oxidase subunit 2
MKKILLSLALLGMLVLPALTMAQIGGSPPNVENLSLERVGQIIADAVWIIFTIIAVVMFVVAGIMFLTASGDAEKIKTARNAFLWGVAGVVVAIIAFGIISIVGSVF